MTNENGWIADRLPIVYWGIGIALRPCGWEGYYFDVTAQFVSGYSLREESGAYRAPFGLPRLRLRQCNDLLKSEQDH